MGVKGKKCKFASDVDIFRKDVEGSKAYIWGSVKMGKVKGKKGGYQILLLVQNFDRVILEA